jgi:hypothetical protein
MAERRPSGGWLSKYTRAARRRRAVKGWYTAGEICLRDVKAEDATRGIRPQLITPRRWYTRRLPEGDGGNAVLIIIVVRPESLQSFYALNTHVRAYVRAYVHACAGKGAQTNSFTDFVFLTFCVWLHDRARGSTRLPLSYYIEHGYTRLSLLRLCAILYCVL